MKKRGISAIVATVLVILITAAAIAILWFFILPIIKQSFAFQDLSGRVSVVGSGGYTVYDPVREVAIVQVKRDVDDGVMDKNRIYFSAGGDSYSSTVVAPESGGVRVYAFNFTGCGAPDEVSVAPIFVSGSAEREGTVTSRIKVKVRAINEISWNINRLEESCVKSCSNGVQDGDETGEDCGGFCDGCEVEEFCLVDSDCLGSCLGLVCDDECSAVDDSCGIYPACSNCDFLDVCAGNSLTDYSCTSNVIGCEVAVDDCSDCSCSCGNYGLGSEVGFCGDGKDNDCDGYLDDIDVNCGGSDVYSPSIIFDDSVTPLGGSTLVVNNIVVGVDATDVGFGGNYISSFIDFDNSLKGWWRMDDVSGGNLLDYTVNNNDGTIMDDAVQGEGKLGKGFHLDGAYDYIDFPGFPESPSYTQQTIPDGSSFTISAWVKTGASGIYRWNVVIFGLTTNGIGTYPYALIVDQYSNGGANFRGTISDSVGFQGAGCPAVEIDVWTNLVVVFNGTYLTCFNNGVSGASRLINLPGAPIVSASNWGESIGRAHGGFNAENYFKGSIDDVMVFDRALGYNEIQALYAGTSSNYPDPRTKSFSNDFTNLVNGVYTFNAYVQDTEGNVGSETARTVIVAVP